jgi:hypothetical protein
MNDCDAVLKPQWDLVVEKTKQAGDNEFFQSHEIIMSILSACGKNPLQPTSGSMIESSRHTRAEY